MTKDELRERIDQISFFVNDVEERHIQLDNALLEYINDDDISELFCKVERWYS